jgi:hypothetical protein
MLDGMIDDSAHDALFSEATIRIGEIHGLVLQSTHVMDGARWVQKKSQFGSSYEWTEFGNEVGQDEIHWWIFEKETNHDELLAMTQKALPAAQKLMNDSAKLRDNDPDSYEALLVSLKDFGDNHLPEIKALHEYVLLLEKRDPMAPRIPFYLSSVGINPNGGFVNDRREIVGIGTGRDLENRLKVAKDVLAEFVKYRRDIVSFRQVPMGAQRNVICLVVVISQAISRVGVSDGQGRFSYPVRRETGSERVDEDKTPSSKLHLKSENREFLTDLRQFVKDN